MQLLEKTGLAIVLLIVVGMATRVVGLGFPPQVIFDEVHFGKFVSAYCCTHERFFDIHPPHAKLLIAGVARLGGYDGSFPFESIGQPYGDNVPLEWLRAVPAVAGILLAVVIYLLLRRLGASGGASLLGGLMIVFDNALMVQSRLISLDHVLLVGIFSAILFSLKAERSTGTRWIFFSLLAGGAAGLAVGSKFTGLVAPALVAVVVINGWVGRHSWLAWRRFVSTAALSVFGFLLVYTAGWVLHFSLLSQPGSGDAWRIPHFEQSLIRSFVRETVAVHQLMLSANYTLTATHPDASPWWSWPLLARPVFYWQGHARVMYLMGNPAVWWGMSALVVVSCLWWLTQVIRRRWSTVGPLSLVLLGFGLSLAPLVGVPRVLFNYHYFTPLVFAIVAGMVWLDAVGKLRSSRQMAVLVAVVVVGWLIVSPISYGWVTPGWWNTLLMSLPRFD